MALFSRRSTVPDTPPDSAFPFWSQSTADVFRGLVRETFAELGSEVTVHLDHVVDSAGTQFGLANLAATCHADGGGRKAWPPIVRRHIASITSSMNGADEFDRRTDDEVLASTYLRLMPTADLMPNMTYGHELAPGITQVLNLDCPTTVRYFTDDRVARFGIADLTRAGLRNLRTVRADAHETLEHDGGRIDVLLGESVFTASLMIVLDEVVARYGNQVDPQVGAFVAAPNRNQLDYHVPRDATVIPSLQLLASFAAAGYRDAAGQLSPHVLWWRPGQLQQVSQVTDDGIAINVSPELTEVLNRLTSEA